MSSTSFSMWKWNSSIIPNAEVAPLSVCWLLCVTGVSQLDSSSVYSKSRLCVCFLKASVCNYNKRLTIPRDAFAPLIQHSTIMDEDQPINPVLVTELQSFLRSFKRKTTQPKQKKDILSRIQNRLSLLVSAMSATWASVTMVYLGSNEGGGGPRLHLPCDIVQSKRRHSGKFSYVYCHRLGRKR
jgi:hypothetical protein